MKSLKKNIFLFILCCFANIAVLHSQSCDSNYFSFIYNASDYTTYSKTLVTPDNSLLCLQTNRLYFHGLTKFTPQGNVIFSYGYTAPYIANSYHSWTDLAFKDFDVSASSCYVSGSVTKHGLFFDNTETPPARTAAVTIKIDKYGKVIWSRFFANATTDPLEFSNIITLNNGDMVGYLTTQVAYPYYGRLVCLSADGNIKWIKMLNTQEFSSGSMGYPKRALMQIKNGNIVLGDIVTRYDTSLNVNGEYHFIAFKPTDGSIAWETSYSYNDPLFIPNIISAYELPDGSLSFQTTFDGALNIITDDKGNIKRMITTNSVNDDVNIIDAKYEGSSGNQTLLMLTSDSKPLLVQIDKDGNLKQSIKYGKSDEGKPPACFAKIEDGYDIFLSDFSKSFRMLRTDPTGRLDCDTLTIKLVQKTLQPFTGNINNIHTKDTFALNEGPISSGFFVVQNTVSTYIERSTVCQKNIPCCEDVVDTNHVINIDLCEGNSFTLPDKSVVQDSGKYYVSYKTLKGCDSVSLYKINIYKNPAALSLGPDTCFNGNSTITLQATDGYDKYTWMNDYTTTSSSYIAKDSGVYIVTVSNVCGIKTDSVHIYDECDFPIYIPNAFTPNGDHLNDVFKVPSLNKDRLIELTIYNRWGKIVFKTNDINNGWDGNVNSIPQQTGTYIYYLQMENLIGKK